MQTVLSVRTLSKNYGKIRALRDVTFEVPTGSVYGILGPNGSGKTTLLGILMNVLQPSGGDFRFLGQPASHHLRKKVGTLLETPNFYHYLSGERNLQIAARIKGVSYDAIPQVLRQVNLWERRTSKFSTYSLGMKQRLAIASALLANPEVLVLDEPTNGLDPVGIAEIRDLIKAISQEGKTIIMASHLLDEVEKVCTHAAVLRKGELLADGPVAQVFRQQDTVEIAGAPAEVLMNAALGLSGLTGTQAEPQAVQLQFGPEGADMQAINRHFYEQGIVLSLLQRHHKSLETKFLELTNTTPTPLK